MMMEHNKVLAFRGLPKRFGGIVALDKFDMEVDDS